jgi:predicted CoA-substrate-specific enzyme activase
MIKPEAKSPFRVGIDIGSTTAKVVVLNPNDDLIFSTYQRHKAETLNTLKSMLNEAVQSLGDVEVELLVTGSAGLGISEKFDLPFIQEVVASAEVVRQLYPKSKTLIDIGGEDAKMIFFRAEGRPDIRMNGSCAGGTGAFIDEMANLLNVPVAELNDLANQHTMIYPMASRCGVFAKTDLQNLLSRDITKENIAASVFHAVVLQTLATLSRGHDPSPKILFSGGPLTFLPALKNAFMKVLDVEASDVLEVENAQLLPAIGAALANSSAKKIYTISHLIKQLNTTQDHISVSQNRLPALFNDKTEFLGWESARTQQKIERVDIAQLNGEKLFLGVDSGSTTTKLVLIDEEGRVAFDYYCSNGGNAIKATLEGLKEIHRRFGAFGNSPDIARSMVTGYGEDLIRAAYGFDEGMVETLAHFKAAKAFDEQVSFILDIGGQDMKAIFVKDGFIQNIEINEACSSGCGSFIESFAGSMGYNVADFAQLACEAEAPCDLGTRCTVFMNSRVKQALREGAEINDISSGLAYSVIKNALHKVLKVTDTHQLGEHIVVQGGTFRNPAIQKAMEHLLGRQITCPEIAELMGAYGAALTALDRYRSNGHESSRFMGLENLDTFGDFSKRLIRCNGCENKCAITKMIFSNGNIFYSGNRCEKIYTNSGKAERQGISLPAIKYDLLFDRQTTPNTTPKLTIGIPRVLGAFEDFPFWNTLFVECGIEVHLSAPSSNDLFQKGAAHIMSENLCYPAKLVSGHMMDLIEADVDRIFFPMVFYAENNFSDSANSYNCPIVSGYADVVRSVIDPQRKYNIPLDMPAINLDDKKLLKKACIVYLTNLGISSRVVRRAFTKALKAQSQFKTELRSQAANILQEAKSENRSVILLLGRPYHIDPLINHKIPDILTNYGLDVITEDSVPLESGQTLDNRHVMTQWEYINRYYHAARWAGGEDHLEVVLLNSFGCGPDPFILEEVSTILGESGKTPTIIRIDEIESTGSTKLRLRSMMESIRQQAKSNKRTYKPRKTTRVFQLEDRSRSLIVPDFSEFCSPPIVRPFIDMGYEIIPLPPADRQSVDVGLKYTNNEICYPGIITIGDLVKALQSGNFDPSRTAIGFSQTGGQCRASSYPSMVKKALVGAGFEDVPVVTLSTNLSVLNDQPGFEFGIKEYMVKAVLGMAFTDALSDMYHSSAIREKHKGAARKVADKYLTPFMNGTLSLDKTTLLETLDQAVADFNSLNITHRDYPKVGIVGEIYVKYNLFSNNHVAEWLMEQDIEVVMPTFLEFFAGGLVSQDISVKTHLKKPNLLWMLSALGMKLVRGYLDKVNGIMQKYHLYHPHPDIQDIARRAEDILSLNHQYGEGWLIAGEIASFVKGGVQNVLCLQPFGCIANHVIAKGVQKRIKELYPQVNLLFLDADAGVSEVNFFNRMHFFINHAKNALAHDAIPQA